MTTAELILESRKLAMEGANGFDSDEALADWLARVDAMAPSVADKALARRHVAAGLREAAAGLRDVAAGILARADRQAAEADRVDDGTLALLVAHREATGADKVQTPDGGWAKVQVRKSQAVEVADVEALPPEYRRVMVAADKTAISNVLKAGGTVAGAVLVDRESEGLVWSK